MKNPFNYQKYKQIEKFLNESELHPDFKNLFDTLNVNEKIEYIASYNNVFSAFKEANDLNEIFNDVIKIKKSDEKSLFYYISMVKFKYNLDVKSNESIYDAMFEKYTLVYFTDTFKKIYSKYNVQYDWLESDQYIDKELKSMIKVVANLTNVNYTGDYTIDSVTLYLYDLIEEI